MSTQQSCEVCGESFNADLDTPSPACDGCLEEDASLITTTDRPYRDVTDDELTKMLNGGEVFADIFRLLAGELEQASYGSYSRRSRAALAAASGHLARLRDMLVPEFEQSSKLAAKEVVARGVDRG